MCQKHKIAQRRATEAHLFVQTNGAQARWMGLGMLWICRMYTWTCTVMKTAANCTSKNVKNVKWGQWCRTHIIHLNWGAKACHELGGNEGANEHTTKYRFQAVEPPLNSKACYMVYLPSAENGVQGRATEHACWGPADAESKDHLWMSCRGVEHNEDITVRVEGG